MSDKPVTGPDACPRCDGKGWYEYLWSSPLLVAPRMAPAYRVCESCSGTQRISRLSVFEGQRSYG